jgi:hypothetical protein
MHHGEVVLLLLVLGLVEVHEHGDERRLAVCRHQRDHLVLDGLDAAADLVAQTLLDDLVDLVGVGRVAPIVRALRDLAADLLPRDVDERGQVGQGDGLAAVLAGGHLGDDLRRDVAGRRERAASR